MPELPEVETIKNGLCQHIQQQQIQRVTLYSSQLRYPIDLKPKKLIGQRIITIERRSKYLLFLLSQHRLLCHLGMSGRLWLIDNDQIPRQKHDHVDIQLDRHCLRYHDPRRFGALLMMNHFKQHRLLKHLGPEPLSRTFNSCYLQKSLTKRSVSIKQALMNATIVVGIGNIYANEALFHARIHPQTPSHSLDLVSIKRLVSAIKKTLKAAIYAGGTTLKDFTDIQSKPGYFSQQLAVYGRHNQACLHCHNLIRSLKQQGRRSFYCPHCQSNF